jgi:hypothetical protein
MMTSKRQFWRKGLSAASKQTSKKSLERAYSSAQDTYDDVKDTILEQGRPISRTSKRAKRASKEPIPRLRIPMMTSKIQFKGLGLGLSAASRSKQKEPQKSLFSAVLHCWDTHDDVKDTILEEGPLSRKQGKQKEPRKSLCSALF